MNSNIVKVLFELKSLPYSNARLKRATLIGTRYAIAKRAPAVRQQMKRYAGWWFPQIRIQKVDARHRKQVRKITKSCRRY